MQNLYYNMISAYASKSARRPRVALMTPHPLSPAQPVTAPLLLQPPSCFRRGASASIYAQSQRTARSHAPPLRTSPTSNHEIFGADAKGDFLAYRTRVAPTMPIADPIATPFWYSFNAGRIHFLAFDIDQEYSEKSPQYKFIVEDLKSVDRTKTPIVYVFQHFPMFCTNFFWCQEKGGVPAAKAAAFRELYEPLFNAPETRVHVYVAGHVHAAEIEYPVATGALVPSQKGFDNITTTFNAMIGFPGDEEVCCNDWVQPKPSYSAWRTDDVARDGGTFGMGEFVFTSDTSFVFKAWSGVNKSVLFETAVTLA